MEQRQVVVEASLNNPMRVISFLLFFGRYFLVLACNKRLIRKDDLTLINEHYSAKYLLCEREPCFRQQGSDKKGYLRKIWIESTASILKVKCYNSNEKEKALLERWWLISSTKISKVKQFTVEYLDQLIAEKLVYYDART